MTSVISNGVLLRDTVEKDLPEILEIYNDAVVNLTATFDLAPQSLAERRDWFRHHGAKYPIISAEIGQRVVGFCSLSPLSQKRGYARTVELSVYVHRDFRGKGVGRVLMKEIISRAQKLGHHAIISIIAVDNESSVLLHQKFGFEHVGHLREVGYKFEKWQDVDYYELLL